MDPKSSLSDRRQFLKLAGLGSAGAAAVFAAPEAEAAAPEGPRGDADVPLQSDHVQAYYRLARF